MVEIMTIKTEEKIMETALKIFAERGYSGAKTKVIAEKAGFSEMTLFRKFKTKKNLYDRVMERNHEKIFKEFQLFLGESKYENIEDFLKSLINNIRCIIENNFDYIIISMHEGPEVSKTGDINNHLIKAVGNHIKSQKLFKNSDIDFEVFAFNIITFTFFIIFDKNRGKTFNDHEEVIKKFISYSARCI